LRGYAFELGLLPACGILITANLPGARRIDASAVDACELRLEARAHRIDTRRSALRLGIGGRGREAENDGASQDPYRAAGKQKVRHDPPSERSRGRCCKLLYDEVLSSERRRTHRGDFIRNPDQVRLRRKTLMVQAGRVTVMTVRQRGHVISASRGSVTSFPGHECGGLSAIPAFSFIGWSALTGNRDVFVASAVPAGACGPRNRIRHLIGPDASVSGGLCKIA
jgi:hypothetical protein